MKLSQESNLLEFEFVLVAKEVVVDGGEKHVEKEAHFEAAKPLVVGLYANHIGSKQEQKEAYRDLPSNSLNVPEGELITAVLLHDANIVVAPILNHEHEEGAHEKDPHAAQETVPQGRCAP